MEIEELITITAAILLDATQHKRDLAIRLAIRLHEEVHQALAPLALRAKAERKPMTYTERSACAMLHLKLDELRHAVNTGALAVAAGTHQRRRFTMEELERFQRENLKKAG